MGHDGFGRTRRGTSLVFWFLLLPPLLSNLAAFVLPLIRAPRGMLAWTSLTYSLGGIPLVFGVLDATVLGMTQAFDKGMRALAIALRIAVVLDIGTRIVRNAIVLSQVSVGREGIEAIRLVVDLVFVICGTVYMARVLKYLQREGLARGIVRYGVAYCATSFAGVALGTLLGKAWEASMWAANLRFAIYVLLGVWGLVTVWRFKACLTRLTKNQCLACGYSLCALPEPRCPECGTPILAARKISSLNEFRQE